MVLLLLLLLLLLLVVVVVAASAAVVVVVAVFVACAGCLRRLCACFGGCMCSFCFRVFVLYCL